MWRVDLAQKLSSPYEPGTSKCVYFLFFYFPKWIVKQVRTAEEECHETWVGGV